MTDCKVHLPGHGIFWFLEDEQGGGPLAPFNHCDDKGNIVDFETAFFRHSYAHVFPDGQIKRYNEVIGHKSDLVPA